jgi:Tol biopolymer transport system component
MDLRGGAIRQLTSLPAGADQPNWSHDDAQIVFHSGASVYLMAADGSNPTVVGVGLDDFNAYKYPSLSLDGTEVLFDRNNEIDARKIDQSGQRYVVQNWTTTEETPALSPDGVNVAYAVFCATVEQISVTAFAGYASDPCRPERITPAESGAARRPSWGPVGVIAFERGSPPPGLIDGVGTASIALSTGPGATPCNVVDGPGDSRNPSWAPAGFQPSLPAR